jgi:hypothetical protein
LGRPVLQGGLFLCEKFAKRQIMPRCAFSTFLLLSLLSCGPPDNTSGPGGVSAEDAEALDVAAEKLDIEAQGLPEKSPAK